MLCCSDLISESDNMLANVSIQQLPSQCYGLIRSSALNKYVQDVKNVPFPSYLVTCYNMGYMLMLLLADVVLL